MKVLVLEADMTIPDDIERIIRDSFSDDEIKYITNAYYTGKAELIEGAKWADAILFESTFTYQDSIGRILDLMLKVGKPYLVFIKNESARHNMDKLLDDNECFEIQAKGIKLYQIDWKENCYDLPFDFKERAERYRIEQERLAQIEAARLKYVQSANQRPTGRKIKICQVSAFGEQWSELRESDIVDEVDMSEVETKFGKGRGVWVMGKTEGVKLLNEHPHKEYEILTSTNEDAIITEVLTMLGNQEASTIQQLAIKGMFAHVTQGQLFIDDLATEILDLFGLERRGIRAPLRKYLHSKLQEPVEA